MLCIPDSTGDTDKMLRVEGLGGGKQLWLDRCPLMTSFIPVCGLQCKSYCPTGQKDG